MEQQMITRQLLSTIVISLMALNVYVATVPESPRILIIMFGAVAIVAQIVKDQYVDKVINIKVEEAKTP